MLKLASTSLSPIIDPHLSPDGTMLAYVRDHELHVINLSDNEARQLTFGANGNTLVSLYFPLSMLDILLYNAICLEFCPKIVLLK